MKTVPKIDNSDQVNLWNFVRFHKEKEKDQQQKNYAGAQAGQTSTMMTPFVRLRSFGSQRNAQAFQSTRFTGQDQKLGKFEFSRQNQLEQENDF